MTEPSAPYPQHDAEMPQPYEHGKYQSQIATPNLLGNSLTSPVGAVYVHPKADLDTGLHQPPPYGLMASNHGTHASGYNPEVGTPIRSVALTPPNSVRSNPTTPPTNYIPAVHVCYDATERASGQTSCIVCCVFTTFLAFAIAMIILLSNLTKPRI